MRFRDFPAVGAVISSDRRESRNLSGRNREIPPLHFVRAGMTHADGTIGWAVCGFLANCDLGEDGDLLDNPAIECMMRRSDHG